MKSVATTVRPFVVGFGGTAQCEIVLGEGPQHALAPAQAKKIRMSGRAAGC